LYADRRDHVHASREPPSGTTVESQPSTRGAARSRSSSPTGELNPDGKPDEVSAHVDGSATDFGRCVAAEIRKHIEAVRLPPIAKRSEFGLHMSYDSKPPAK
jgi:hypothetical protein